MKTLAVHAARWMGVQIWRPGSLTLVCTLLLGASAQNEASPVPLQSESDATGQLRAPLRVKRQQQRGIPQGKHLPPSSRNGRSVANAQAQVARTPMPLFLDAPQYPTGSSPASVAVGDFNGDGNVDLATANRWDQTVSVLLSNGDGTFQAHEDYSTGVEPSWVAVGDFNGDGRADLITANFYNSSVSVLLGNGDGSFQAPVNYLTGPQPSWVAVGDFNGDGRADLATAGRNGVSVLLGKGDGTFQAHVDYPTDYMTSLIAAGDFNGDGKLDLAAAYSTGFNGPTWVSVLLGNGNGTFQPHMDSPAGYGALSSVVVADFNNDGKPDLAIANADSNPYPTLPPPDAWVSVLLGNGDGTFQAPVTYPIGYRASSGIAVGDFNGDGKADLAATNSEIGVSVLLGNGDGTFQVPLDFRTAGGSSVALGDFNNDGKADLAITNSNDNYVSVLLGNGDGTFQAPSEYVGSYVTDSFAVGDFNSDGKPDLATANKCFYLHGSFWGCNVSVLLGNGNGMFQGHGDYPKIGAINETLSIAVGDFNGDSIADLATANAAGSVSVLLGNGNGTFQPHMDSPAGYGALSSVVVADFNNDGKPDLAIAYTEDTNDPIAPPTARVSALLGNGDGTFQAPVNYPIGSGPSSIVVGDFNDDGKSDLATSAGSVLLGNGDGTFQVPLDFPTAGGSSVAQGDFNNDGKADLTITNSNDNYVSVLLGNGDGTFQAPVNYLTGPRPSWVAVGDFNGDGRLDLATAGLNGVSVLLGNGDGTFHEMTKYMMGLFSKPVMTVADFNRDEAPDLAIASTESHIVTILLNIRGTMAELHSSATASILGEPITLTATIHASVSDISLPAPTGTVAFLDGTNELDRQTLGADGVVTLATATLTAGTHNISAVYSGDANFNPHTVALVQVVNGPDFSLAIASDNSTVKAGASVEFTLTSTAMYGFAGPVSLSCSISPRPALAPTCALNPQSINLALNGSATTKLTVATTGPTASVNRTLHGQSYPLYAFCFSVFSLALLGTGCGRSKKKSMLGAMLVILVLASTSQLACGGGGSGTTPPPAMRTPAGQYSVTVNATSGSMTHSTAVTITVQ